jgi:hypothetical protein
MGHASLAEARAYGIGENRAVDATLTLYLDLASKVVDDYCGRSFGTATASTVTVRDAHNARVVLPGPFTAVTAVTVNGGIALEPTAYQVESWGLRLVWNYRDADGFPVPSVHPGRGVDVTVAATFGYATVPVPVKQATLALTDHLLARSDYRIVATVDAEGNPETLPTAAASPQATEVDPGENPVTTNTTGLIDADRWLRNYRRVLVG